MNVPIILNDPPYGTKRSYNGMRLAKAPGIEGASASLFLLVDAVIYANLGQKVPQGFYNVRLMIKSVVRNGEVLLCGTCMDVRCIIDEAVIEGAKRSTMKELAERTLGADQVLYN